MLIIYFTKNGLIDAFLALIQEYLNSLLDSFVSIERVVSVGDLRLCSVVLCMAIELS